MIPCPLQYTSNRTHLAARAAVFVVPDERSQRHRIWPVPGERVVKHALFAVIIDRNHP
jgi:hypothetical protein